MKWKERTAFEKRGDSCAVCWLKLWGWKYTDASCTHRPGEAWMRGLRGSQVFRDAEDEPKHPRVPKLGAGRVADSRDSGEGKMLLVGET